MGKFLNLRKTNFTLCVTSYSKLEIKVGVNEIDDEIATKFPSLLEKIDIPKDEKIVEPETPEVTDDHEDDEEVVTISVHDDDMMIPEMINIEDVLKECEGKTRKQIDEIANKYGVKLDRRKKIATMLAIFKEELESMNK